MKKILAITLCFTFIGMGSVLAQTELPKHSWNLGTEISYIKYKEPGLMEEKGMMYGIVGSYTYRGWLQPSPPKIDKCMLKLEGKFAYGQLDYDGALQDGTPYTMDGIDDYLWELRGLGGYDFSVFTASTLTPYIGIGYRYLNDDSSSDPAGYERESNYIYSPIGVEIITPLKNSWSVGAMLEYDIFWWGKQISHFSDFDPGFNDLENRQKKGYGIRGSIKFQKKGEKLYFVIEPFIRYWNIKKSEDTLVTYYGVPYTYGWEPKNNSTELGIKFALGF